jgi:hypothetical protein
LTRLDHDALDRLLIRQLDVISRRQALAAGVTDNALRHRLRLGGPWRGLLPGVYMAIAVEVDSREWHTSPEDHAKTLARGRRMARYQIVVLRFTPRQIRTQPGEVISDIKAALDGACGRALLNLKTIKANNGAAA